MDIAKLTSKGQLTLPINIRKKLNLQVGDQVAFVERNGEFILVTIDRLHINEQEKNVDGVIASLLFEDLEVSEEMKCYAKKRLQGYVDYNSERKKIINKYTELADNV